MLLRRLSLVAEDGGDSSCDARASHCGGFSCCKAQALGTWVSVVVARGLCCGHVGSSPTRDQAWVPCIGRQISYPLHHQGCPVDFFFFDSVITYIIKLKGERQMVIIEGI